MMNGKGNKCKIFGEILGEFWIEQRATWHIIKFIEYKHTQRYKVNMLYFKLIHVKCTRKLEQMFNICLRCVYKVSKNVQNASNMCLLLTMYSSFWCWRNETSNIRVSYWSFSWLAYAWSLSKISMLFGYLMLKKSKHPSIHNS